MDNIKAKWTIHKKKSDVNIASLALLQIFGKKYLSHCHAVMSNIQPLTPKLSIISLSILVQKDKMQTNLSEYW